MLLRRWSLVVVVVVAVGAVSLGAVGAAGAVSFRRASFSSLASTALLSGPAGAEKPMRPGRLTLVRPGWLGDGRRAAPRAGSLAVRAALATPTPPFTECPAIGADTSCGLLVDVTESGVQVLQDLSQGPYDGGDDTLVGVLNQSGKTLGHLALGSNTPIFAFDGDGICSGFFGLIEGCPFGPTGYEGPGTEYIEVSPEFNSGVVSFTSGVAPGATAYFALEEPLSSSAVVSGGPGPSEQGGAPNRSENATTCGAGDPVNCATGALWHEFTDASIPGRGVPLKFTRTYSSLNAETDGPLGFGWTDSYNMSLTIDSETGAATVREEGGSEVTFPSNGAGGFVTPPRVLATLVKNEDGTYSFSRYSDHIQYVFSESGQLLREVDRNGNTTTLTYSGGLLEKVSDPSGRSLTFTYTGSHIQTITDPMGRTTTFSYDESGNLVKATDPLGRSWSFTYGANHLLLSMTDPRGDTTTNTYDEFGRVVAQIDPAGRQLTWSYAGEAVSPEGGTTTLTDARGDVTFYEYKNLELMSITHGYGTPEEATTSYQYDPISLGRTMIVDPDGNVTHNTYDSHGDLTGSTDPLGRTTYFGYGPADELTFVQDPRGTPTYYSYDSAGNLLEKQTLLAETGEYARTTYSYEAEPGEVTSVTDPDGHTSRYAYDNAGDRTSATNADGNTTTYSYNADGELTSTVAPAGNAGGGNPAAHTTSYTYDADGELTEETNPLGHATSYAYDGDGNRVSVTDANNHTTQQVYNADSELTEVKRPDGSTLKTEWDPAGNMTAQIDGARHATTYAYDPLNRLISVTDPVGRVTGYRYDPAGRKTAKIDAEGQTTEYGYDTAGELTSISYSDGQTSNVTQGYDQDGNRVEMTDGSGTSTYVYDSLNRMISATDGSGATVKYTYDLAGHLTALTYPNGQTVARSYDSAGHLESVTDWQGHTTRFAYDPNSNLTGEQYANGVNTKITYDAADQLSTITDMNTTGTIASFNYTRDPVGQVSSETANNGETQTTTFTRDALDQLTGANETHYGYDAASNPTTFGAATQTFDPAGEVTESTKPVTEPPHEETKEEPAKEPPTESIKEKLPIIPGGGSSETPLEQPHGGIEGFHASKAPSPKLDTVVSASTHARSGKITIPKLHTHSAHDLVIAFISAPDGKHVKRLSGDGLKWSLVARSDGQGGTAEVWQAHAKHKLHGPITAQLDASGIAGITVAAFKGATAYVAAHATSQGHASSPSAILHSPAGSLLWAVGHSSGQARATAPVGGRLVWQLFDRRTHSAGWVQQTTATSIAAARTADKGPAGRWNLAAVAIATHAAHVASISHATALAAALTQRPAPSHASPSNTHRSASDPVGTSETRHFLYNARGDRIQETIPGGETITLSYDQADRLIAYGTIATYAYNGDGLRVSRTVNSTTTEFVWNQAEAMPELLQDGATYYIYGPEGQPIEQITSETPTYLHQDQKGSTSLLTGAGGNVVGRYNYNSWGEVTTHTGSATTNLQYDGQYTDAETGFQYLRARYYDPSTGQFLTQDPAFAATRSNYGFAGNDPCDLSDFSGLSWYNPFSWSSKTWRTIGEVAGGVGLVAGAVALCAATACIGDAAVAAIGGGATLEAVGGGAELLGTAAAVTGGVADVANIANDCVLHPGYQGAGNCVTDFAVGTIDAVTFGTSKWLIGGKFVVNETRTIVRNMIGIAGGETSILVDRLFWKGC